MGKPEAAIPAVPTAAMIPPTLFIAKGPAFGLTAYALIKIVRGKVRWTDWLLLTISALLVVEFVWLSGGVTV